MQGFHGQVLKGQQSSEGQQMSFFVYLSKRPRKVHSEFHRRQHEEVLNMYSLDPFQDLAEHEFNFQ